MFAGGDPVLLGAGVDLEDVGPRAEYGLLSGLGGGGGRERETGRERGAIRKRLRRWCLQGRIGKLILNKQDFVATCDSS